MTGLRIKISTRISKDVGYHFYNLFTQSQLIVKLLDSTFFVCFFIAEVEII